MGRSRAATGAGDASPEAGGADGAGRRVGGASACRNGAESHSHCGTATLRWWLADMQAEHNGSGLYRLSRAPHAGHDRGSAIAVQPPGVVALTLNGSVMRWRCQSVMVRLTAESFALDAETPRGSPA